MRGPIGGWFVWEGDAPALLVGGGSGVVPLMAMLRFARKTDRSDLVRMIVSARTPNDLFYADELPGPETTIVYTREAPPSWSRPPARLMPDDVAPAVVARRHRVRLWFDRLHERGERSASSTSVCPSNVSGWSASVPPADADARRLLLRHDLFEPRARVDGHGVAHVDDDAVQRAAAEPERGLVTRHRSRDPTRSRSSSPAPVPL